MDKAFWYPALEFGGVFGSAVLCLPVMRRLPWGWLFPAALYLAVDAEVLVIAPSVHGWHWNWIGKAASILLALLAMRVFRLSRIEVGLKLPRRRSWPWLGAGLAIAVVCAIAGSRGLDREHVDLETLIFQSSMLGLAEELVYRGVAFALLVRGFGDERLRSSEFAAVLITSCCFGLGHLEPPPHGPLPPGIFSIMMHFWARRFGSVFLIGALFALMRRSSGSLFGSVLAHGAVNIAATLAAGRV